MPRLPLVTIADVSDTYHESYRLAIGRSSGLNTTIQTLFCKPRLAELLDGVHDDILKTSGMEPWIACTVGLTVAHELDNHSIWEALLTVAATVGVRGAVVDAIAAGTAPRGLLPKEGIWAHFSKEILNGEVRDSTWQAVTHLVGDEGAIALAALVCYYEMMCRLNTTFQLERG